MGPHWFGLWWEPRGRIHSIDHVSKEMSSPRKGAGELTGLLQPLPKSPANDLRTSQKALPLKHLGLSPNNTTLETAPVHGEQ